MKRTLKMIFKILGIILLIVALILIAVYMFVLQYPNLKENPKTDKWYRVTSDEMKKQSNL